MLNFKSTYDKTTANKEANIVYIIFSLSAKKIHLNLKKLINCKIGRITDQYVTIDHLLISYDTCMRETVIVSPFICRQISKDKAQRTNICLYL